MRDSKSSGEKTIKEVQELRARKPKLERAGSDITERTKTEEKLRQSEQRFRSIFDNANDIIGFVNTTGKIIEVNKKVADILGYEPDELVGKNFMKCGILQIKNAPTIIRLFKELVKRRELPDIEGDGRNVTQLALRHKKGHTVFIEASTTAIKTDGKLEGFLSVIRDITERKQAEEALRQSEERYRDIFNSTTDAILVVDLGNHIVDANPEACKMYGYSYEDMIGLDAHRLVHPDYRLRPENYKNEIENTGQAQMEAINLRKDGTPFNVEIRGTIFDHHGEKHFLVVVRDITERKRAEEALRESETTARAILNATYDLAFLIDTEGTMLALNETFAKRFGKRVDELIGSCVYDLLPPDVAAKRKAQADNAIRSGRPLRFEDVRQGRHLDSSIYPVFNANGRVERLAVFSSDITERKRAEEKIEAERKKLETYIETMVDGVSVTDANGILIQVNKALAKIHDYSPEEMVGKPFIEFVAKRDIPKARNIFVESIKKKQHVIKNLEITGLKKDGSEFSAMLNIRNLWDEEGKLASVISVVRDITDRKKADEALRESEEKLRNVVERANDGIVILQDGLLKYVNPRTAEITGYTVEEMINTTFARYVHPDEVPKLADFYERRFAGEEIASTYETVVRHKDGSDVHIEINAGLVTYEGKPADLAFARDITERKRAEEALRLERDNFTNILDSMEDGVYIVDQNYDIQYVNPALKKEFGPCEGRKCYEYFHDRKEVCPWCKNSEVFAGKTVRWEWYSAKNQRTYDLIDTPLRNHDGSISKLEIFRDITERKKAEEALRESEEKLRNVVERASDGIAILQDGLLKYANPRIAEITGYTVEEMINTPFAYYLHPDELPKVADLYERRMAGEEITWTYETVVRRKDGSDVNIEVNGGLVTYEGKPADLAFARDITERKKAEQELLKDQVKLKSLASELSLAEERERRRIATELHDRIGQSLVISKINLEALRKSEYSKKIDKTLNEICNSLAQTIADTRTLTFDLSSPILYELGFETAVAEWLAEQIEDKHGIATQFEDDGRPKPMDDDIGVLLFRNVRELLINIVKHAHAHKVKVAISKVGEQICVSVQDDGVGFDPVEAASTAAKRAEFGLFSIRQSLEELGGRLEIESEPGRGCKVTMTAPLKPEKVGKTRGE